MPNATPSLALAPQCAVCHTAPATLLRCAGCKAQRYCSKAHQTADWAAHKGRCSAVRRAQRATAAEEARLRALPGDFMTPPNPFETSAGHFWGIFETRDYMRARFAVVEALLAVDTFDAVDAALAHVLDMLRLCRSDNMGVRDMAPALMLRLGRDQAAYDFVKWWATEGARGDYDWGDMDLPYLDLAGEDVTEGVEPFAKQYLDLPHSVAAMLLKVRVLLDLRRLDAASTEVGRLVPPEILDQIRTEMFSSVVARRDDIAQSELRLEGWIEKLEGQVQELYTAVKKANRYFWPVLTDPGELLNCRPEAYSSGSREEAVLALNYMYNAFNETPGALDKIRELIASDK